MPHPPTPAPSAACTTSRNDRLLAAWSLFDSEAEVARYDDWIESGEDFRCGNRPELPRIANAIRNTRVAAATCTAGPSAEDATLVHELLEAYTRHRPSDYEAREPRRQAVLAQFSVLRAMANDAAAATVRIIEHEIATTQSVRAACNKDERGDERLDGALQALRILLRKVRAIDAEAAPAEAHVPPRAPGPSLLVDVSAFLGEGGALRLVNVLLRNGAPAAPPPATPPPEPPESAGSKTVRTTPIPTREEREAAVRFLHPTCTLESFERWMREHDPNDRCHWQDQVERLAGMIASNRGSFADGIEAAACVVRGWEGRWEALGPIYAAICRLSPPDGDPE